MSNSDSITYNQAYTTLKNSAEFLRNLNEPDVDVILPEVAKGMEAYKICKERTQKALEQLNSLIGSDT